MKTLEEIINNANYERMNSALKERSIELAEVIHVAMDSAEISEIGDYSIRSVRSIKTGVSDTSLYIEVDAAPTGYDYHPEYRSLEHRENHYLWGDFNCPIKAANSKDRLKFLNDAKSILEEIDSIKQKRMENIENALKAAESI